MMPEEKTAEIRHVVTDDGHFGFSYCTNCNKDPYVSDDALIVTPSHCPHCGIRLVYTSKTQDFGGSDF